MDTFLQTDYLPLGYKINSFGNVKSPSGKILKPSISNSGYLCLNIKNKGYFIHRAIAFAFVPLVNDKIFVNHKDGNKLNNSLENLEWCTKSENSIHAYKLGLKQNPPNWAKGKFAKDHNRSIEIICDGKKYFGYSEASRETGLLISTIYYRVKSKSDRFKNWLVFSNLKSF